MLKKTVFSFLFFCFFQLVLYSCCKPKLYHRKVDSINFNAVDTFDQDASSVSQDNFILHLNINYINILLASVIDASMITSAHATSTCDDDYIMPNKIAAVNVYASETILGIDAGNALNEKLEYYIYDSNPNQELDGLVDNINQMHYAAENINLVFNEQIPSGTTLSFTITLSLENGSELSSITELIQIE